MINNEIRRESIIKDVITIFIDVIGFLNDKEKLSVNEDTDIIKDFKVDGDDATEVIMELEKYFSISASYDEWGRVSKIHEISDLIIKYLVEKP